MEKDAPYMEAGRVLRNEILRLTRINDALEEESRESLLDALDVVPVIGENSRIILELAREFYSWFGNK